MGLSSSQARLLHLTGRMHQIEYKAQKLEAQKLQLANDSNRVYNDYQNALEATKIQYRSINSDGSITYLDATLAALEGGLISGYTGEKTGESYLLQDTQTGKLLISRDYAASIGVSGDDEVESRSLETYIKEEGGSEVLKPVVKNITYVQNTGHVSPASSLYQLKSGAVPADTKMTPLSDANMLVSGQSYTVSSAADLENLSKYINAGAPSDVNIYLTNDINMSGSSFSRIENFKGTFNGNGHKITGLQDSLFYNLSGATVKNIELVNSNVNRTADNGVGALAGFARSSSIVENVKVTGGSVTGVNSVGGLIGSEENSTVTNCSVDGTSVKGDSFIGGLLGAITNSTISNSKVDNATISGTHYVAGFGGRAWSNTNITNCSSDATITTDASAGTTHPDSGGFIGYVSNSTFTKCKADGTITDTTSNANSVITGFAGLSHGTARFDECISDVDVTTDQVLIAGFTSLFTDSGMSDNITINNCSYTGSMNRKDGGETHGFIYVTAATGTSSKATLTGTNYATQRGDGKTYVAGQGTITGDANATSPYIPSINPTGASMSPSSAPSGAVSISSLETNSYEVPTDADIEKNIEALLAVTGAATVDPNTLETAINTYINNVKAMGSTNEEAYSYLSNINSAVCTALGSTPFNSTLANQLLNDINNGNVAQTRGICTSGTVHNHITQSSSNQNSSDIYEPNAGARGKLTVPSADAIASNIMATFQKAEKTINYADVINYLMQYEGSDNNKLATLAYINDLACSGNTRELETIITNYTPITDKPAYMGDPSNYDITRVNGTAQVDTENVIDYSKPRTQELMTQWYAKQTGYRIIGDDAEDPEMDKSREWLTNMLANGSAILVQEDKVDENGKMTYKETSVATNTFFREVSDEKDLKKAEAKYEADMKRIDNKDKKYDTDLAALETERNATKEEMETLKTVAKDNVERTFKLFG